MIVALSKSGVPIRLGAERWKHIAARHPEMRDQREHVLETLREPAMILEGDGGAVMALRFYEKTPLTSKFLCVVYREIPPDDGFVLTAYYTAAPSARRKTLWKP